MVNAQDITLDEILENHYEVMKLKELSEVNSVQYEGKIVTQGMELPFVQKIVKTGKLRTEVEFQGNQMIQAYNGEEGWLVAPWTGSMDPQDMPEDQTASLKEQADFVGELWNWKEKVENLELEGKEDMEGTEVYKLKVTKKLELKEGETEEEAKPEIRYYYLDAENFVVLKIYVKRMIRGQEMEVENYQSNFKEVEGYIMPHSIETRMGGQTVTNISIESIKFNEEYDDSIFDRPVKEEKEEENK
jgi:outer membrane lipoprotein-sorting protein